MILVSSFKDVASIFEQFAGDVKGKTVTFIPTASVVEKVNFFVKSGRKALEKMGLLVDELDVSTATTEEITDKLTNNDYIYITGGNTFFLLQELRKSGADKVIIREIKSGKLYIGESAGLMVVAPNVEFANSMDSIKKAPELDSTEGLGMIDFYPVPHYTNMPFIKAVTKIIATYGESLVLKPISNHQAILIHDDDVEIVSV